MSNRYDKRVFAGFVSATVLLVAATVFVVLAGSVFGSEEPVTARPSLFGESEEDTEKDYLDRPRAVLPEVSVPPAPKGYVDEDADNKPGQVKTTAPKYTKAPNPYLVKPRDDADLTPEERLWNLCYEQWELTIRMYRNGELSTDDYKLGLMELQDMCPPDALTATGLWP